MSGSDSNRCVELHAACVCSGENCILILGPPGSGKTTLVVALSSFTVEGEGGRVIQFIPMSDDTTLLCSDGKVRPGGWNLVCPRVREGVPRMVVLLGGKGPIAIMNPVFGIEDVDEWVKRHELVFSLLDLPTVVLRKGELLTMVKKIYAEFENLGFL